MAASDSHNDSLKTRHVARVVGISPTVIPMWKSVSRMHPRRTVKKTITLAYVSIGIYALTS